MTTEGKDKKRSSPTRKTGPRQGTRSKPSKKTKQQEKSNKTDSVADKQKSAPEQEGQQNTDKSEGLASEAIRIVEKAASILEEEISAGIIAAKRVEERYINVNTLRSSSPEQVLQRFRKDAHEVLDILLDLVNLSVNALNGLSERSMNIRSASTAKGKQDASGKESVPELTIPQTLKPGESGTVAMLVENDSEDPTTEFTFKTTGLLSADGEQINAEYIAFDPPSLTIAANDLEKVKVSVSVPAHTPPGQYSGLLQTTELHVRAILSVRVE